MIVGQMKVGYMSLKLISILKLPQFFNLNVFKSPVDQYRIICWHYLLRRLTYRSLVEELELELGMVMGLGMELELGMALGLGMELEPGMELELGLGSLKRHHPMSCIEEGLPIAGLHRSQLRRRILVVGTKLK